MSKQRDNSTFAYKVALRRNLLAEIAAPVILETHGGFGAVYQALYAPFATGAVIEKDARRAQHLARQRPTWAVYEGDAERSLRAGAGAHLTVNFVDFDPYGEPWPVIDAFLQSARPWSDVLAVAVNDGIRGNCLKIGYAWRVESLADMAARYGIKAVYTNYLEICQELLGQKFAQRGYRIDRWAGYYCGDRDGMTHYGAVMVRRQAELDA